MYTSKVKSFLDLRCSKDKVCVCGFRCQALIFTILSESSRVLWEDVREGLKKNKK